VAGYLLETNVISETRKIRADPAVLTFLGAADVAALFLSVLTLGELRKGVAARRRIDPVTADQLGTWVAGIELLTPIECCQSIHQSRGFGASCLLAAAYR
jgi:predicted nucleic acid-binding protein